MTQKYTAAWVEEQAEGAIWLNHHTCSLCNSMVGYGIEKGQVWFKSSCDCTSWSEPRPSSFNEIANWLNMQSSDEIRDQIMLGLVFPQKDPIKQDG